MEALRLQLINATGQFMEAALKGMPGSTQAKIAEAIETGGWLELRVGILNNASTIRLLLLNVDGDSIELGSQQTPAS